VGGQYRWIQHDGLLRGLMAEFLSTVNDDALLDELLEGQ